MKWPEQKRDASQDDQDEAQRKEAQRKEAQRKEAEKKKAQRRTSISAHILWIGVAITLIIGLYLAYLETFEKVF